MATIKDIAREAGVSHGTVSNVLNKTGKVRIEKIRLVEKAVARLGYTPNEQAQLLRQGTRNIVGVILPSLKLQAYRDMYEVIQEYFRDSKYDVSLYITNGLEVTEKQILESLPMAHLSMLFIMPSASTFPENFSPSCPVVFFNKIPKHFCLNFLELSFDYNQAGREICNKIGNLGIKTIVIIQDQSDTLFSPKLLECFNADFARSNVNLQVYSCSPFFTVDNAFEILNTEHTIDLIVTFEQDYARALTVASSYLGRNPSVITFHSYKTFVNSPFEVFELNYKMLAQEACTLIQNRIQAKKQDQMKAVYKCRGFRKITPTKKSHSSAVLRILSIDNSSTDALKKLLCKYHAYHGTEVVVNTLSHDDLYTLLSMGKDDFHDLIRLDVALLQELGKQNLLPLTEANHNIHTILEQLIPDSLQVHSSIDSITYALPFDPSSEILLYRKDLFEDAVIKRQYYEMFHENLCVPQDFEQFNRVASFFTKSYNSDSPIKYGSVQTYGNATVASCDFLPRLLYDDSCIIEKNGKVVVDTHGSLKALENYLEAIKYTEKKENKWWSESADDFASGDIAMLIVFSNYTANILRNKTSQVVGKVGIAPVPGSSPLLGGGVIGINKRTKNLDMCYDFLQWFYEKDTACEFTYLGGLSAHQSVYDNWDIMHSFPWITEIQRGLKNGTRGIHSYAPCVNITTKQFEYILGTAVKNAVSNVMTAKQALEFAQSLYDEFGSK